MVFLDDHAQEVLANALEKLGHDAMQAINDIDNARGLTVYYLFNAYAGTCERVIEMTDDEDIVSVTKDNLVHVGIAWIEAALDKNPADRNDSYASALVNVTDVFSRLGIGIPRSLRQGP